MFKERENQSSERLSEDAIEEIFEVELNEFNRPKIQMSSIKQVTSEVTAVQKRTVMDALKDIRARLQKFFKDFNR